MKLWGDTIRLRIVLKSKKGKLRIPFNYNHIISAIVYNKIYDLELAQKLHSSQSYKFFTFLIRTLVEGFLEDQTVKFINEDLLVQKIELLPLPDFEEKVKVNTLSPIIARTKKEVDGQLKTWDLAPSEEQFYRNLENNLINKYKKFKEIEETDKKIVISSEMRNVKRKRITIDKGDEKTFHRAFLMDLVLEGDLDLIKFAYDAGLGEKSGLGFGMVDIV